MEIQQVFKSFKSYFKQIIFHHHPMLSLPCQLSFQTLLKLHKLTISLQSAQTPLNLKEKTITQSLNASSPLDFYSPSFLKTFLTIKLNSLSKITSSMSPQQTSYSHQLSNLTNQTQTLLIPISQSQTGLMKHLLSSINASQFASDIMSSNFYQGNCLSTTILHLATKESLRLLYLHEVSCALSFQVFDGRLNAFIPIVHEEKNHSGQLLFANRMNNLILYNNKTSELGQLRSTEHSRVQDAYSTRCSPQIAGISYEIVTQCIQFLDHQTNQYQLGYIPIGQQFFSSTHSNERATQLFDYLSIALHQITSVSFVRSERILNRLINRLPPVINERIQQHSFLFKVLEAISGRFLENKNLCSPITGDTTTRQNYEKDVENSGYLMYRKYVTMWGNMKLVLVGEVLIASYALKELKNHYEREMTPVLEEIHGKTWEMFGELGKLAEGKEGIKGVLKVLEEYVEEIEERRVNDILKYLPYQTPHQHHQQHH